MSNVYLIVKYNFFYLDHKYFSSSETILSYLRLIISLQLHTDDSITHPFSQLYILFSFKKKSCNFPSFCKLFLPNLSRGKRKKTNELDRGYHVTEPNLLIGCLSMWRQIVIYTFTIIPSIYTFFQKKFPSVKY